MFALTATLAVPSGAVAAAVSPASAPASADARIAGLDLDTMTVLDLQQAMDSHRLSSTELTVFYLARIKVLNPTLHAVIQTNRDALNEAAASDVHRLLTGHGSGPLDGIPVLLKDNIGFGQTTDGSEALLGDQPAEAFVAQKLQAAGAVIIGKGNLSEWTDFRSTHATSGWSAVGGLTANPYVLDHNTCGSSSGPAVAAAADLATVTIGTETDGSIMCPSGLNGVVGFKPTLGEVSRTGVIPISAAQDTPGPITRNVTDAAAVESVIAAADPNDPATAGTVAHDYTKGLDPHALAGKRIGVWLDPSIQGDPGAATTAVFNQAVAALTAQGATAVPVTLPDLSTVADDEPPALANEFKYSINRYLAATPGQHPADLAGVIAFNNADAATELRYFDQNIFDFAQTTPGDPNDPTYSALRQTATSAAQGSIDGTLAAQNLDAIVAPTNAPAWISDFATGDTNTFGSARPAAVAGYPSVTVPMGFVGPLPVGLSFIGTKGSDASLLAMAYAFEQQTHARKAPTYLAH
ncbi:amidase [Catenulispora sp. NF23]|uniref:Amidase n=1 Tax=Catenulispora pinistramenti TaxID=2705254 RepID=A0ABS5L451_9ACTN|nr:amidase [Catenulispora pinistramenti]MBS2536927.1 amidase [Catenulispora pinistramenti]MBS2553148.1 amidase [Catenulispora pinistramenti]